MNIVDIKKYGFEEMALLAMYWKIYACVLSHGGTTHDVFAFRTPQTHDN